MASPGELVEAVAGAFNMPKASVIVVDRNLAEAGYRNKGGRGRAAAKMTAADAAALLIAIAGGSHLKDAAATFKDYASLPGEADNPSGVWTLGGFSIPALQELPSGHSFSDALTALISAAMDGSILAAMNTITTQVVNGRTIQMPRFWSLSVRIWGPYPQAAIDIVYPGGRDGHHYNRFPRRDDDLMAWAKEMESDADMQCGLRQMREFTMREIMKIARVLST